MPDLHALRARIEKIQDVAQQGVFDLCDVLLDLLSHPALTAGRQDSSTAPVGASGGEATGPVDDSTKNDGRSVTAAGSGDSEEASTAMQSGESDAGSSSPAREADKSAASIAATVPPSPPRVERWAMQSRTGRVFRARWWISEADARAAVKDYDADYEDHAPHHPIRLVELREDEWIVDREDVVNASIIAALRQQLAEKEKAMANLHLVARSYEDDIRHLQAKEKSARDDA
jgi:hypothetical protein